jgi:hypothetical protein
MLKQFSTVPEHRWAGMLVRDPLRVELLPVREQVLDYLEKPLCWAPPASLPCGVDVLIPTFAFEKPTVD